MTMPDIHPLEAVLRAVRGRLTTGDELWGNRAYYALAPTGTRRPFVVFSVQEARELNENRAPDALVLLLVKVISVDLEEGLRGAYRIAALLNDAGDQDGYTPLGSSGGWRITTVTQERMIEYSELIAGTNVFHVGNMYRFRLSSRS